MKTLGIEENILVRAAPSRVLDAFFDADALAVWWEVVRSVTTPRPLGIYAVEWPSTSGRDDLLGPLGGIFYGRIVDYRAGREFFVADAWWLPPEGDPLGPMGLHVLCTPEGKACRVRVKQQGGEDTPRWQRYYDLIGGGWSSALESLKQYVETRSGAE